MFTHTMFTHCFACFVGVLQLRTLSGLCLTRLIFYHQTIFGISWTHSAALQHCHMRAPFYCKVLGCPSCAAWLQLWFTWYCLGAEERWNGTCYWTHLGFCVSSSSPSPATPCRSPFNVNCTQTVCIQCELTMKSFATFQGHTCVSAALDGPCASFRVYLWRFVFGS